MVDIEQILRAILFFAFVAALVVGAVLLFPGNLLITYLIYLVIIAAAVTYRGYDNLRMGTGLWGGLALGALLITPIFLLEVAMDWLQINGFVQLAGLVLLLTVILEVLVAAGEEMAFRGIILPDLTSLGTNSAIVISSILFASLHIPSILFFNMDPARIGIMLATVFLAGVLMALLYLRLGLYAAIGFHFSWNTLQYHVFTLQQGVGILQTSHSGPVLLTGGAVGPEAGVLGVLVVGLGIILILFVSKKRVG